MKRWKKWVVVCCAGLVVLGVATGIYLGAPAPPPKVSLTFQGFAMDGTNRVARICFKNEGRITVGCLGCMLYDEDRRWPDIATGGFVWGCGGWPAAILPSSNIVMSLPVTKNFARWRVQSGFEYFKHTPIKRRFIERYVFTGKFVSKPHAPLNNALFQSVLWCLDRFPEPKPLHVTIFSEYITNQVDYVTAPNK